MRPQNFVSKLTCIQYWHKYCRFYYHPQTKFAKVMFLHLSVSHSVYRGYLGRYPPWQAHPPGRYTPLWQVHPPGRYTPLLAGTPPSGRYTPFPLGRYTPLAGTPPGSSACWEIQATSGRYASYWNAFLFN